MNVRQKALLGDFTFLVLGVFIALAVTPLIAAGVATLQALYDESNPPARFALYSALKVDNSLRMRFRVTRERDCIFLNMAGMSGSPTGPLESATVLRREDGEAARQYPVGVAVLSPPWIMSPVYGPRVVLHGYYDCDGRLLKPKLIDQEILP